MIIANQGELTLHIPPSVGLAAATTDGSAVRLTLEIDGKIRIFWLQMEAHDALVLRGEDPQSVALFERLTLGLRARLAARALGRLADALRNAPEMAIDYLSGVNSRLLDDLSRVF